MNLTQITAADLKQILNLLEQKESLQAQAAKIEAELAKFESGEPAAPAPPVEEKPTPKAVEEAKAKPVSKRRAKRGAVKAAILDLVKAAGKPGITVKDIAATLGMNYHPVFNWFYKTGEKVTEIKKVGPGQYTWATSTPVSKPVATVKPEKSTAKKQGKLKDTIIDLVKTSGKAGITVKEIAGTLGIEAQRIYVWFAATGKKVNEIKKIAPGTYRWVG